MTKQRKSDYPIHEMFLNRWSPRAFTGQPITQEELLTMLEAARWAASSYNSQPWRFLYALRDTARMGALPEPSCAVQPVPGRKTRLHWSFSYRTRPCDPLEAVTKFRPRHTRSMLEPLPATSHSKLR